MDTQFRCGSDLCHNITLMKLTFALPLDNVSLDLPKSTFWIKCVPCKSCELSDG